jgi:uncharacterized protein YqcC (DUF446 family)
MSDKYEEAARRTNELEAEMQRIGFWQNEPLAPEQLNFCRAFGADTMAFSQWLQFVFVPRVRQIVEARGAFPAQSFVGAQAIREFDGMDEEGELARLLCEFDRFIEA